MSLLSRLFAGRVRKSGPEAADPPPQSRPPAEAVDAQAPAPDQIEAQNAVREEEISSDAAPSGRDAEAGEEAAPAAALQSLSRYRTDPAYKNFMDKAKRPPGSPPRRPRLNPDDFKRRP